MRGTFITFLRQSFFIRMIVLMLLVSIVPLIILAYLAVNVSKDAIKTEVNKINYELVEQVEEHINLMMAKLQEQSYHYGMLTSIQNALEPNSQTMADFVRKKELITILDSGIAVIGDIESISLYSKSDDQVFSSRESFLSISDSRFSSVIPHFIHSQKPYLFYDKDLLHVDSELLRDFSLFLRKIPINSPNEYKGVLVISIENALFKNLIKNIHRGSQGSAYVISPSKEIIATTSNLADNEDKMRMNKIINEWDRLHQPNQFVLDDSLISIKQSEQFHRWIVLSVIPLKEVMASTQIISKSVFYLLIFLILLGLIIVFGGGYYLYKPLQSLKKHMQFIKQGNFDARIPVLVNNEFGELGILLNSMAFKLQSLVSELKETEELKRRNEIRLLQSQINPHFMYNSLNTITMFAMLKDYEKIREIMRCLTSLLRYSMENHEQSVPLTMEIKYLFDYIDMLQLRYDCQFQLKPEIDLALNQMIIPKLLLQPLIENAIFHGILAKETDKGTIIIRVYKSKEDSQSIIMEIQDDGKGMTPQRLKQVKIYLMREGTGEHIGLTNVWERTRLVFGLESRIEVESQLEIGTIIRLILPMGSIRIGLEEPHESI
jgi:two-component system sensor histidine kinase YesM